MLTEDDVLWVVQESHDCKWDNTTASRIEWLQRNAEVVARMRETMKELAELQFRIRGLEK